jgi:hypothetical protein
VYLTCFFTFISFSNIGIYFWYFPIFWNRGVFESIGDAYWDLSFIDHSDNFKECNCAYEADVYSNCGSFLGGNISVCEEKQFQSEVLSGHWVWDGPRYRDLYLFNITNPEEVRSAGIPVVQTLNPIPFVDVREFLNVDRTSLDEMGILAFATKVSWSTSETSQKKIIIPHYVFAALLANGVQIAGRSGEMQQYENYYPLLSTVLVQEMKLSPRNPVDYLSKIYSESVFPIFARQTESMQGSYFTAERLGLQGLSFVRSIGGSEIHCGYDRDCTDRPADIRISFLQTPSCEGTLDKPFCNPRSLKYQAHGLQFGVSSLRWLPGASYYGIDKVDPADSDNIWDYTAFNKVGTTWPAVHDAFFVFYDVVLAEPSKFVGVKVLRWHFARYHQDDQNCDADEGPGVDSRGIDCSSPKGMLNVGPAFDAKFPGPIYASSGTFRDDGSKVLIERCTGPSLGCNSRGTDFELLTHEMLGFRVGFQNSHSLSIRLQPNNIFANMDSLIPLYWMKESFYMGQKKLLRIYIYEKQLEVSYGDYVVSGAGLGFVSMSLITLFCGRKVFKANDVDTSGPYADKPCV